MYAELEQKMCPVCNKVKEKKEFHADKTNSTKLNYRCKKCDYLKQKEYRIRYKDKLKIKEFKRGLRRNYGMTVEQYNELFNKQNGCCAICETHQKHLTRSLAVDHCHDENVIRGLLCDNCNPMLGYAKDDTNRLLSAVEYLNKFKK